MSAILEDRALRMLYQLGKTPRMMAHCREAFLVSVCTILEMDGVVKGLKEFMEKWGEPEGCVYAGLAKPVADDWAHLIIEDALEMLAVDRGNRRN